MKTKMNSICWRGKIKAMSPISHGSGNVGNIQQLNTMKVVLPDHTTANVPFISGNSLKHRVIRKPGMDFMLKYLGLDEGKLSKACLQLLYSGGFLSAKGSTVDLGKYFQLCELIPLLGLLGGSLGNVIQESRVQVDHAILYCAESVQAGIVPPLKDEPPFALASNYRSILGYTRGDATKQRSKIKMLTSNEQDVAVGEIVRANSDLAHGRSKQKSSSTQMRYEVEVVAPGSEFAWEIRVHDADDIEVGAFYTAIAEFCKNPYVGGKSAIGHGKVKIEFDEWAVNPQSPITAKTLSKPLWDAYQKHLDSRGDEIEKALVGL